MAWDDAPPSASDLQTSTSTSWDAAPPKKEEMESPSVGGFLKNAVTDVGDTAKGVGNLAVGLATHPVDTTINTLTHLPRAVVDEGKRLGVGELITGHPISAVEKFGGAAYDKPLTTALDVLPAAGAVGKALGIGGDLAKGAEMASEAGKVGDSAAGAARLAEESIPKPPLGSPAVAAAGAGTSGVEKALDEAMSSIGSKAEKLAKPPLDQAKEFLEQKYGQIAKRPGWADTVSGYMKEHSQNMALKELGAAPGQVRKIGAERAHALADYALDNDLIGPKTGTIGRNQKIAQSLDQAGGAVGAFRKMAADRGAVHDPGNLIGQIRANLDKKYLGTTKLGQETVGGIYSGEASQYKKALAELSQATRADDVADKVSELFSEARNQDRLKQPSGAFADVARQAREINHGLISKALKPEEMAAYEHSLEDYGALTQIKEFAKRRASTEAGGRLGPGSGISRAAVQKFLDSVGYRTQAKVMSRLSNVIRQSPEIAAQPKALFRNYVDEAVHAIDEMGDAQ